MWLIEDNEFSKDRLEQNGSKFLLGNGYMGYRGTLEEYSKEELAACNILGFYDKVGDNWREPVNAPNGFYTRLFCNNELMSVLSSHPVKHIQQLCIKTGVHTRKTAFEQQDGNVINVEVERFLCLSDVHLLCMKYSLSTEMPCEIRIETGIDGQVWDINGPHLIDFEEISKDDVIQVNSYAQESGAGLSVSENIGLEFEAEESTIIKDRQIIRNISFDAAPGKVYSFYKYVSVYNGNDLVADVIKESENSCINAAKQGYKAILLKNISEWEKRWEQADVKIGGDEEGQLALRYSIYQLLAIAPTHSDRVSIPARGLSGQVYKGAIFWDTEMFMLPFFIYTNPQIARNLVRYRINTLDGARRKAAQYGYRGAFYAWESQDTGDDACTHFAVTDVFTGRPMRTYFRDKQIHISADVVYGIWEYFRHTGDKQLLVDGGAEVILECARFFYSYAYFKKDKDRFEILDVTGPDEYHERVGNNAYTNMLVKNTLETALQATELLREEFPAEYRRLIEKLGYEKELENIKKMNVKLYLPEPHPDNLVIEQFDGYNRLEDTTVQEVKSRLLNPNEYWGGGNGVATTTKIIKQADVVLMLNLFKDKYAYEIKKANWEYYEPRTEHGSSLSPCVYAMLAAHMGDAQWGYKYFLKTATIDLTGESKQYVGTLYIGGTHPAANGGAWMAAVLGFGGLGLSDGIVEINPQLPEKWTSLEFNINVRGQLFSIYVDRSLVNIKGRGSNSQSIEFSVKGNVISCGAAKEEKIIYKNNGEGGR